MARSKSDRLATSTDISQAAEDLFAFAVDREDIKWSLDRLPDARPAERTRIEYELQALKIVTVGWSIAYLLGESPRQGSLQTAYWTAVQGLAAELSQTAGLLIGQKIDYFKVLKQRFATYLTAMSSAAEPVEPSRVIGPTFARCCGMPENLPVAMAGARLFKNAVVRVHEYLSATGIR